jgi:hypothetical protein
VHGTHLIRSRDLNLPEPSALRYPVFDQSKTLAGYYTVDSFAAWQKDTTRDCRFAPCLGNLIRPISQLGMINVFESAASSVYHGLTLSARRRMSSGVYFRLSYTYSHAIDDGQDAFDYVSVVQNSHSTRAERAASANDQRHRFLVSWIAEPRPFHRDHPILRTVFNNWRLSSSSNLGSGRPVTARVRGDFNMDENTSNDRLPGISRAAFTGPGYASTDLRIARRLQLSERMRVEFLAESFNVLNRVNKRFDISDDGFTTTAARFVASERRIEAKVYPAYFREVADWQTPKHAYASRQVQFALRLSF